MSAGVRREGLTDARGDGVISHCQHGVFQREIAEAATVERFNDGRMT
jgi:hypothetical protein